MRHDLRGYELRIIHFLTATGP
ncbi:MAG: hypothetical protein RJA80_651, partial [Actinomycetota bacterium]